MPDSQHVSNPELTRQIAEIVAHSNLNQVAPDSVICANHAILDWLGVTYAGISEPLSVKLRQSLATGGPCSIVGTGLSASAHDAALINGATSHALDYDDVNLMGHPTAPILPAILAVGETEGSSGEEILLAFIAGYEAATLIAQQAMPSHYIRGFHSTGTLGAFGAAAGAARLLKLDTETTAHALGLAGTQAAGLKSMFGTMAKPFHAGKAASNGVLAAMLAAKGFEARPDVLETAQGFLDTQSDAEPKDLNDYTLGDHVRNNLFKYHAACYLTHSTMEGLKQIISAQSLTPNLVKEVAINVPNAHLGVCNIQDPVSGLETKFSLRHCAALVLHDFDTASIATYSDENAVRSELVSLRQKVNVIGNLDPGTQSEITLTTKTGQSFAVTFDVGVPAADLKKQQADLTDKFVSLTGPLISSDSHNLVGSVLNLSDHSSIKSFLESLPLAT